MALRTAGRLSRAGSDSRILHLNDSRQQRAPGGVAGRSQAQRVSAREDLPPPSRRVSPGS